MADNPFLSSIGRFNQKRLDALNSSPLGAQAGAEAGRNRRFGRAETEKERHNREMEELRAQGRSSLDAHRAETERLAKEKIAFEKEKAALDASKKQLEIATDKIKLAQERQQVADSLVQRQQIAAVYQELRKGKLNEHALDFQDRVIELQGMFPMAFLKSKNGMEEPLMKAIENKTKLNAESMKYQERQAAKYGVDLYDTNFHDTKNPGVVDWNKVRASVNPETDGLTKKSVTVGPNGTLTTFEAPKPKDDKNTVVDNRLTQLSRMLNQQFGLQVPLDKLFNDSSVHAMGTLNEKGQFQQSDPAKATHFGVRVLDANNQPTWIPVEKGKMEQISKRYAPVYEGIQQTIDPSFRMKKGLTGQTAPAPAPTGERVYNPETGQIEDKQP